MKKQNLLFQRFWHRVFNNGSEPSVLVPNDRLVPEFLYVSSMAAMHTGGAIVIPAKPYVPVPNLNSGLAVATVMSYLRSLGVEKGDRVAVLAWNCPEWIWADLAIQSLGAVTVPIYPNSAADMVNYIVRDSGARAVLSNEDVQLAKVDTSSGAIAAHFDAIPAALGLASAHDSKPFFRHFVPPAYRESKGSVAQRWAPAQAELRRMQSHLAQLKSDDDGFADVLPSDLATIIYTSGSTGVPKGGAITHGAIAAACKNLIAHGFRFIPGDVVLSYLPLAHVYERVDGSALSLWEGVPMAFSRVEDMAETMKKVRPSVLLGVPAVWRKMRDRINAKLKAETGLRAKLVNWALAQKTPGFKRSIADLLVFRKIRGELGGELRILMSGGAPISQDILQFFDLIGLELLQGYGLTETSGGITVNLPSGERTANGARPNKVGSVGRVIPGVAVRIEKLSGREANRDGEIWIKSDMLFAGYWNLPEETAKSVTADGWFRTGDLGYLDDEGFLFITGRLKRLLKTDGGKYVAPEKIEKATESEPIVHYIVPVGDGKPFIAGVIFINQLEALQVLARHNVSAPAEGVTATFLGENSHVILAVQAAVDATNNKLERWEQLKTFRIIPVEATVANGLLTPTLKIRTEEVLSRYASVIEEIYAR